MNGGQQLTQLDAERDRAEAELDIAAWVLVMRRRFVFFGYIGCNRPPPPHIAVPMAFYDALFLHLEAIGGINSDPTAVPTFRGVPVRPKD